MKTAEAAAILATSGESERIGALLAFFGIPFHYFHDRKSLDELTTNGQLRGVRYALIVPLSSLSTFLKATTATSAFAYAGQRLEEQLSALRGICRDASMQPLKGKEVEACVTEDWPEFTGPMHGVKCRTPCAEHDHLISGFAGRSIVRTGDGAAFVHSDVEGCPVFISASAEIPDLQQQVATRWYDVKSHFFSAVAIVMYLRAAFAGVCWEPHESGACLIIDDPLLRPRYGFCNFEQMDQQMQEHQFTTNIAFIPWNWRRSSTKTASLVKNSNGRLSISVHGCDHTGGEFGSTSVETLHRKSALAKIRMEGHSSRTGVSHDLVMVFPQGVFSSESMGVLQQHNFVGVVNTEIAPINNGPRPLRLEDVWNLAILRHNSFPLFTRRYPRHGIENFAFDLLLGKPCLIVEHHEFFKKNGQDVIAFVQKLKALNCPLRWQSLGDVIRRCYHWRPSSSGGVQVKMAANELLIENTTRHSRMYEIQKADADSAGVSEVRVNGNTINWTRAGDAIHINCRVEAGDKALIRVLYRDRPDVGSLQSPFKVRAKTALRRYLSEFRDNTLSRNERLVGLARFALRKGKSNG